MSELGWQWNGARWWKVDLHTHSPASEDYGKGPSQAALRSRTPKEWLLDFMKAEIDCVAVTDHNSGAWIDKLADALNGLRAEKPEGFRELFLLPGVEISVNGGTHLLAVFGANKTASDIDSALGACGFEGQKGSGASQTTKSFFEVVAEIERLGGLAIPAHVDKDSGLFKLTGSTLAQALGATTIFAMELSDLGYAKPTSFAERKVRWTEIIGSDSHHPPSGPSQRFPGSHWTWIKMRSPCLEGVRLALLDGPLSIQRSDQGPGDPNEHAPLVLESLEVSKARYLGRAAPFIVSLNPWLNAIIGGRGTGKSTLVEFLRIALGRFDELPIELTPDFTKYRESYLDRKERGLLTSDSVIRVIYRKDGTRFRVQWNSGESPVSIEEETEDGWIPAAGEVSQRFPVRLFSQKQIFQLASDSLSLLKIVDEAEAVDRRTIESLLQTERNRYFSLRAGAREVAASLSEELRLRGEIEDTARKMLVFERAGHSETLKEFERRDRQREAISSWEAGCSKAIARIVEVAEGVTLGQPDSQLFDAAQVEDQVLLSCAEDLRTRFSEFQAELRMLAEKASLAFSDWATERDSSAWHGRVAAAAREYQELVDRLALEGAGMPAGYGQLLQNRKALEERLTEIERRKKELADLQAKGRDAQARSLAIRYELTRRRKAFLEETLQGNAHVRIKVIPYGARNQAAEELRNLLQREDGGFDRDIENLVDSIYAGGSDESAIEASLTKLRLKVREIAAGQSQDVVADRRFASHLERLRPETLDRIDVWSPEDELDVQFSVPNRESEFRSIQGASPGQKTAALLAFLLSYGDEPLVLDQPEDDLDNHLIYNLIVAQLREVKRKRQVIVVTHNANIVVNGDAELVVALAVRNGESKAECEGSLQEEKVRETICEVMEGGKNAFEERYRRIALGGRRT